MISRLAIFVISAGLTTPASAYVAEGHQYDLTCNANGYQLESKYPVARAIGSGAGTSYLTEQETIFLGRSCDAFLKPYGFGTWCWANGGFFAEFDDKRIDFPRQELICDPEPAFYGNCNC